MTKSKSGAMFAGGVNLPGLHGTCLAPPASDLVPDPMTGEPVVRGYRGWDHMRCTHPTPPPPGYHHCQADPGCTILITAGLFCFMHGELADDLSPALRARPQSSLSPKHAAYPWSRR